MPLDRQNAAINRGTWAVIALVLALIWGGEALFFRIYQAEIIEGKRQELVQLNNVVAQHSVALLRSLETDLRVMVFQLQSLHGRDPRRDPAFFRFVSTLTANTGNLIDIRLITDDGTIYGVSPSNLGASADARDREHYRRIAGGASLQVQISPPVISRLTGRWVIPVAIKIPSDVPRYRVIVAVIDVARLIDVQKNWLLDRHSSILLLREDATVLSRAPFNRALMGRRLVNTRAYRQYRTRPGGTYVSDSQVSDGVRRLVSYAYLDEFRLFVMVTRGYDDALEGYYTIRNHVLAGTVLMTLCLLAAGLALQRAQRALFGVQRTFQRQATLDDLTQIRNRRAFLAAGESLFRRARERHEALSVLMLDIDHFKRVNDRCGHAVGDAVLRAASDLWRRDLRQGDLIGRLGGEEFAIVLPATGVDTARRIAERLRLRTAGQLQIGDTGRCCSVSIGVAALDDGHEQLKALLKQADAALYRAKRNGRNRVEG